MFNVQSSKFEHALKLSSSLWQREVVCRPDCLFLVGLQEQTGGIEIGRKPDQNSKFKVDGYSFWP